MLRTWLVVAVLVPSKALRYSQEFLGDLTPHWRSRFDLPQALQLENIGAGTAARTYLQVIATMIATFGHSQGQILWLKQKRSCWVGQPVEPRINKHRQLRQYQQLRYNLQTNALLHTPDRDVQPAPAIVSGAPLDTNTIAAIVTGKPIVGTVSPLKASCLDMLCNFHICLVAASTQQKLQA